MINNLLHSQISNQPYLHSHVCDCLCISNFTKWRHSKKVLRSVAQAFDLGIASQVKNMWVRLTGKKEKSVSYAREDLSALRISTLNSLNQT